MGSPEPPLSLRDLTYTDTKMPHSAHRHIEPESALPGYLKEAQKILALPRTAPAAVELGADFEHLRWFWLPAEFPALLAIK
jgi:hypothetical protein